MQSDGGGEQIPQGTFSLSIIDAKGNNNSVTIEYKFLLYSVINDNKNLFGFEAILSLA